MNTLRTNSFLQNGKYRIIKVLGQGGFGITYLAEHEILNCRVAIKEFFFKDYCNREEETSHVTVGTASNKDIVERFKLKFIKEARTIFKLKHPNIIQIHDIFTENGTAYYVMDYIEGESLDDIVKRNGAISENDAVNYIKKVGSALSYIHSININHLDVKPSNIMIRKADNQVVLIDFGVAKQYDSITNESTTTTPVGISHGYSPMEQYLSKGINEFSPQSDVYALAATLFKLLTGVTPPEALIIQEEGFPIKEFDNKNINPQTILAIKEAMKSRIERTPSIDGFICNLNVPNPNNHIERYGSVNDETTQIIGKPNDTPTNNNVSSITTNEGNHYTSVAPPKSGNTGMYLLVIGFVSLIFFIIIGVAINVSENNYSKYDIDSTFCDSVCCDAVCEYDDTLAEDSIEYDSDEYYYVVDSVVAE